MTLLAVLCAALLAPLRAESGRKLFIAARDCAIIGGEAELPQGTAVYAYTSRSVAKGRIVSHKTIGHPSDERDTYRCASFVLDDAALPLPPFSILSTVPPKGKRPAPVQADLPKEAESAARERAKRLGLDRLNEVFNWDCEDHMPRATALEKAKARARFTDEFAISAFPSKRGRLVFAALKSVDTARLPGESVCEHPLFIHESVLLILKRTGKLESEPVPVDSLTGSTGGDGTRYLMDYTPRQWLDNSILDAVDADADGTVEVLRLREGAEASWYSLWRIENGALVDLKIEFSGGL